MAASDRVAENAWAAASDRVAENAWAAANDHVAENAWAAASDRVAENAWAAASDRVAENAWAAASDDHVAETAWLENAVAAGAAPPEGPPLTTVQHLALLQRHRSAPSVDDPPRPPCHRDGSHVFQRV